MVMRNACVRGNPLCCKTGGLYTVTIPTKNMKIKLTVKTVNGRDATAKDNEDILKFAT